MVQAQQKRLLVIRTEDITQFGEIHDTTTVFISERAAMHTTSGFVRTTLEGDRHGEAKLYRRNDEGKWIKADNDATTYFGDEEYVIITGSLTE